jgi:hypothetical protein
VIAPAALARFLQLSKCIFFEMRAKILSGCHFDASACSHTYSR